MEKYARFTCNFSVKIQIKRWSTSISFRRLSFNTQRISKLKEGVSH